MKSLTALLIPLALAAQATPPTDSWPTYNGDSGWQVMHLTPEPMAQPDTHRDRYLFLNQQWAK